MSEVYELDKIALSVKSRKLLKKLLKENEKLEEIMVNAQNETEALVGVKNWIYELLEKNPKAKKYYEEGNESGVSFKALKWSDYAAIRILDYIKNAGRAFIDLNLHGQLALSNPIKLIWLAAHKGTGGAKPYFFEDMIHLFRQLRGEDERHIPHKEEIFEWMERYPSGLDPRIVKLRQENKDRIINIFIDKIDDGEINDSKYNFEGEQTRDDKYNKMLEWWNESAFHLRFAVRSPDLLNELLGHSLDPDTMNILYDAEKVGIPFFINPYYLSLLHVRVPYYAIGADLAIRDYIIYSRQLIEEFGHISAWEKEDIVEPGKPNAAGWLLPSHHNIHRRYPEVAILIPDTMGRACGGLCSSCQRMFDFQDGRLNFNLRKLMPDETWDQRLEKLMDYFANDSQLKDILITGGDALMSADQSLEKILNEIYKMAIKKKEANKEKPNGEKYAEIIRVRLGTRLPIYLPQRITDSLLKILKDFKNKALKIGIEQFVIQTHFESPMEITPEAKQAVHKLISAGWLVTNQHVFTASASRRGHNPKLRKVLNDIGVLPYYTFTVKGYMENNHMFAPNSRAVQESIEEKTLGNINDTNSDKIKNFPSNAENMLENIESIRDSSNIPFLATDRNVLNLPGVGKSLSFRVIGITRYGRRILEFEHDATRFHSPIINQMKNVVIIESKSISEYLRQLDDMGEDLTEYGGIYGYSIGETEKRMSIYEYPEYDYKITEEITNIEIPESSAVA
ncbi:MAG: KamA family protein [Ignavibacteriales bacterium]|nr:KamA family protein [Ignavibacteriales bacterium]